ncbi:KGG domain-containing protein [Massilia sp. TWP1-3-3]|uniref:KGG domain-containing protein n=1 Tax=Massilia sp. TWP1-3-3 TaxID=2804573 RepID=UPI003CEEEB57
MATSKEGNKQGGSRGAQGGSSNRGFASMDPQRQREIASEGGKAAHEKGTAHEFTSEEARRAGSMSHGNRQAAQSGSGSVDRQEPGKQKGNKQEGNKQEGNKQEGNKQEGNKQEGNKQEGNNQGDKKSAGSKQEGGASKPR